MHEYCKDPAVCSEYPSIQRSNEALRSRMLQKQEFKLTRECTQAKEEARRITQHDALYFKISVESIKLYKIENRAPNFSTEPFFCWFWPQYFMYRG